MRQRQHPHLTAVPQAELPFDHAASQEESLRWAHARSGVRVPFEICMRNALLRRCLENVVHAARARRPEVIQ